MRETTRMVVGNEESIIKALAGPVSITTLIASLGPYISPNYFVYVIVVFIIIIGSLQRIDASRKKIKISKYTTIRTISNNGSSINLKKKTGMKITGNDTVDFKGSSRKAFSSSKMTSTNNRHSIATTSRDKILASTKTKKSSSAKPRMKDLRRKFSKSFHYSIEEKLSNDGVKIQQFYDPKRKTFVTVR